MKSTISSSSSREINFSSRSHPASISSREKIFLRALIAVFAYVAFCFWPPSVASQMPQGLMEGQIVNTGLRTADALRSYYARYKVFPQSTADLDEALRQIYTQVFGMPPDPNSPITSEGPFRVLGNLRIRMDATIRNAPIAQWKENPPDNWNAPANSIVILEDGGSQYIVWCAAINGVPIRDQNKYCILFYADLNPPPAN